MGAICAHPQAALLWSSAAEQIEWASEIVGDELVTLGVGLTRWSPRITSQAGWLPSGEEIASECCSDLPAVFLLSEGSSGDDRKLSGEGDAGP